MKTYNTKKIGYISYIHLDITKKLCDLHRDSMSLVQKKNTITLKLKQVCATHNQ